MSTSQLPVISRTKTLPTGQDYNQMVQEGISSIAHHSGDIWTNYNTSDPGITMLQNLTYALVELGVKADLPIRTLLADPHGKIRYENQFIRPQDALTSNPVTLTDLSTLILNIVPAVRAVYLTATPIKYGTFRAMTVQLDMLPTLVGKNAVSAQTTLNNRLAVHQALHQHGSVNQVFTLPQVLAPMYLQLQGILYVQPQVEAEKYVAEVLFALNDFITPYPRFHSLENQVARGKGYAQLFEGPKVIRGYMEDLSTAQKKRAITADQLNATLLALPLTEFVDQLQVNPENPQHSAATIEPNLSPIIRLQDLSGITLIQNNQEVSVTTLNQQKVSYYLHRLLPASKARGPLFPKDQQGNYHDLADYYSLQYQFPAQYHLTRNSKVSPLPKDQEAKVKQLKGYLALMEQTVADFMEQTSQLDELFSFRSGRNPLQVTGKTYFFQGLYAVPGIRDLLKGALEDTMSPPQGSSEQKAWQEYTEDRFNYYYRHLAAAQETPSQQLDRKRRVMEHLLARFGQTYSNEALQQINPGFGDGTSAEVWHISQMLCNFSLISQNRIRTYFLSTRKQADCGPMAEQKQEAKKAAKYQAIATANQAKSIGIKHDPTPTGDCYPTVSAEVFASGLERSVEADLNLQAYYQGLLELVNNPLPLDPQAFTIGISYTPKPNRPTITVAHQGAVQWSFLYTASRYSQTPITPLDEAIANQQTEVVLDRVQLKNLLGIYMVQIQALREQFLGFLWIDPYRLVEWLTFKYTQYASKGSETLITKTGSFSDWAGNELVTAVSVVLPAWSQPTPSDLPKPPKFSPDIEAEFPEKLLPSQAIFPRYLYEIHSGAYQQFLDRKLQDAMPAGHWGKVVYAGYTRLQRFIPWMRAWEKGLKLVYQSEKTEVIGYNTAPINPAGSPADSSLAADIKTLQEAQLAAYYLWLMLNGQHKKGGQNG